MRRACFGQQYPDFSKSFILTTDASGIAVRGILLQGKINKDQSIALSFTNLDRLEYNTYEKEAKVNNSILC